MTPRSFFSLVIKVLGIYLLFSAIPSFSGFLSAFYYSFKWSDNLPYRTIDVVIIFILIFTSIVYALFMYYSIFKTELIVDKMNLDKVFLDEKFEINIHRSTTINIAVIVIGGLLFVDALPRFCQQIYSTINQGYTIDFFGGNSSFFLTVLYFVKMFLGYLMLTSNRYIVNFLELKRRKSVHKDPTPDQ